MEWYGMTSWDYIYQNISIVYGKQMKFIRCQLYIDKTDLIVNVCSIIQTSFIYSLMFYNDYYAIITILKMKNKLAQSPKSRFNLGVCLQSPCSFQDTTALLHVNR